MGGGRTSLSLIAVCAAMALGACTGTSGSTVTPRAQACDASGAAFWGGVSSADPYGLLGVIGAGVAAQKAANCATTVASITTPVVVLQDNGDLLQGTTTSAATGNGTFSVTDGRLTCSGYFNALDPSPTITMQTHCSDGRTGTVLSNRDASGQAGAGKVTFADGGKAVFFFGANAYQQATVALAALRQMQTQQASSAPTQGPTVSANEHVDDSRAVAMVKNGGVYTVPVLINGAIKLNFVVDSGASAVMIPADVVITLMRTGTIEKKDFLGTAVYTLADGRTLPSVTFRIRSLKVGDLTVENVVASASPVDGELLLGQSFLEHFKSWAINNSQHALVLR